MCNTLLRNMIGALVGITLVNGASAPALASESGDLKAAIIYNILRFVDFPRGSVDSTLDLCVKRGVAGGNSLFTLTGKSAGAYKIGVRYIDPARGAANCNVVYLGQSDAGEIGQVKDFGVLTIGDGSAFIKSGGTVGLITTGKQIRFEISLPSAKKAGVVISSKLLRLASRVVR